MAYSLFLPVVALLLSGSEMTLGGNILVLPAEYSHWQNMRVIVDELVARNHSVTVLVNSASPSVKVSQKEEFKYVVFKVNMEKEDIEAMWQTLINVWINQTAAETWTLSWIWTVMAQMMNNLGAVCEGLLNPQLIASLRESHFDVLLYDPVTPCGDLLAETLGLPFVVTIRLHFAYSLERLCGQLPTPPSYVPAGASQGHLTDHMNFLERVENMLLYIAHTSVYRVMIFVFDKYYATLSGKY